MRSQLRIRMQTVNNENKNKGPEPVCARVFVCVCAALTFPTVIHFYIGLHRCTMPLFLNA